MVKDQENFNFDVIRDDEGGLYVKPLNEKISINVESFALTPDVLKDGIITEGILLPAEVEERKGKSLIKEVKDNYPFVLMKYWESFEDEIEEKVGLYVAGKKYNVNGKKLKFNKFNFVQKPIDLETAKKIKENTSFHLAKPLNLKEICEEIRELIRYNIDMDETASTVLALGIVGTYIHQVFDAFPYFWINGVKGTGKSRLLELIDALSYHSIIGADFSAPAIFRFVDKQHATICFDEVERLQHKDSEENARKLALLNCGYRSSGKVHLVEKMGDDLVPRSFNAYSPKFLASINPLGGVLESRCIQIILLRTLKDDYDNRYIDRKKCNELVQKLYIFKFNEGMGFYELARKYIEPTKKMNLKNREWELFKPIVLLCNQLMPDWLDDVVKFIDEQKILASDDYESTDVVVLMALEELCKDSFETLQTEPYVLYKTIWEKVIDIRPDLKKWFKNRTLGNCLKRMGFAGLKKRSSEGFEVLLKRSLIEDNKKRYGLV